MDLHNSELPAPSVSRAEVERPCRQGGSVWAPVGDKPTSSEDYSRRFCVPELDRWLLGLYLPSVQSWNCANLPSPPQGSYLALEQALD